MGGEADDGLGAQDAAGQRHGDIVLAHVDAVGSGGEREVGPVVQHERHRVGAAHVRHDLCPRQQRPCLEMFLPQLDDVHAAGDALLDEGGEIPTVRSAQVEASAGQVRAGRHFFGCALALSARLFARTFSRLSVEVMSATDRNASSSL